MILGKASPEDMNLHPKKMTPQLAEKIQDDIFRKMPVEKKIKLVSQFFEFAKKLQHLNDRKIKK